MVRRYGSLMLHTWFDLKKLSIVSGIAKPGSSLTFTKTEILNQCQSDQ